MASMGDFFMGLNEATDRIEGARKKGRALTGKDFGPTAMRTALKSLIRRNKEGNVVDEEVGRRRAFGYKGN